MLLLKREESLLSVIMHFAADDGPRSETFCVNRQLNYVVITLNKLSSFFLLDIALFFLLSICTFMLE